MAQLTHDDVQRWLDRYIAAWRSYDEAAIGDLFTDDVSYRYYPYADPIVGRDRIVAAWREDQDDPATWTAHYAPYAVDGDRAVAVGESRYVDAEGAFRELYFNTFLLRFDEAGRCAEFTEYFVQLPERLKAGR